jgi:acetyl-CoA acetyltransferase
MAAPVFLGAGQAAYARHPAPDVTTERLLVDAARAALDDAGLHPRDIDGLGVASFTLAPDHAIDFAWRLGLRLRWIMDDPNGGAAGMNLVAHARRALQAGDAERILLVAGDHFGPGAFAALVDGYNRFTREHLAPLRFGGPNALFAFLTQRHMRAHGLARADYGAIAVAQRRWARRNPNAVYRTELTLDDYLAAPLVAPPLGRYDCVPVVSGADAVVMSAGPGGVPLAATGAAYNPDGQEGDGLRSPLADVAAPLWSAAGLGPQDVDLACIYDDYPAVVMISLCDLGLVAPERLHDFAQRRLLRDGWPLNPSGGMLSAGQAGAAGGLHGLVEAVRQLSGRAGARQVPARAAVVAGYGMVLARYGAAAGAAVLGPVA